MTSEDLLARSAALNGEVQRTQESLKIALLTIDKLKLELAYLRRMKYGRSSEQLEHAQLELVGGMVAVPATEPASNVISIEAGRKKRTAKSRPGLREFPEHLPRRTVVHTAPTGHHGGCDCQACGRALREIGQDVSEVLDYEPGTGADPGLVTMMLSDVDKQIGVILFVNTATRQEDGAAYAAIFDDLWKLGVYLRRVAKN